jgi:hypothetical protein
MAYPPTIATEPDLVAWWRLGESGLWPTDAPQTPNFCLDSSGNGNHLTALNESAFGLGGGVWFPPGNPGLPLLDQPGTPEHDDGAIHFRLNDFQWVVWDFQLCLFAPLTLTEDWLEFSGSPGDGVSFMFWTCFVPLTDPGVVTSMVPFTPPYGLYLQLFGDWGHSFGIGSWGRKGGYNLETGAFTMFGQDSDFSSSWAWTGPEWEPHEWHHVAMTLGKVSSGPGIYRRRLYVDGAIADFWDGDRVAVGLARSDNNLTIGGAWSDDLRFGHCAGGMDEFSVWRRELSAEEIISLPERALHVHLPPRLLS